jgi:uncharacterized protein (TIGR02453 family)
LGGKHSIRAPYYIHVEALNKSMLAGGSYMPTPEQLAAVRQAIDRDPTPLITAISGKSFKKYFGSLSGEKLKTPPRGYAADHPAIELLKYKQFVAIHSLTDEDVLSPRLVARTVEIFTALKPLLDFLNDAQLAAAHRSR